jgi:hypothetical protein
VRELVVAKGVGGVAGVVGLDGVVVGGLKGGGERELERCCWTR